MIVLMKRESVLILEFMKEVMQTLMAGLPDVRLATDATTNKLIALARPSEHRTIVETLKEIGGTMTGKPIRVGATFDPGDEFDRNPWVTAIAVTEVSTIIPEPATLVIWTLLAGLGIDAGSGVISGTPTTAGFGDVLARSVSAARPTSRPWSPTAAPVCTLTRRKLAAVAAHSPRPARASLRSTFTPIFAPATDSWTRRRAKAIEATVSGGTRPAK